MMVAGHETPNSGRIFFNGYDVTHQPPHLRRIGMVFQHYAIFPHMTVADNIAFPLRMYKTEKVKRDEAIQSVIDMVRLAGLEQRYPNQLSGGQLQRSEEHTTELQSLMRNSYAVFCLKKK